MKNEINKLVGLAKQYRDYGIKVRLSQNHNTLREQDDEFEIRVYFADNYKTCCVYFDRIEIPFYTEKITIPRNSTAKKMTAIYENAKSFLDVQLSERVESIKSDAKTKRLADISEMKEALKAMESIKD